MSEPTPIRDLGLPLEALDGRPVLDVDAWIATEVRSEGFRRRLACVSCGAPLYDVNGTALALHQGATDGAAAIYRLLGELTLECPACSGAVSLARDSDEEPPEPTAEQDGSAPVDGRI